MAVYLIAVVGGVTTIVLGAVPSHGDCLKGADMLRRGQAEARFEGTIRPDEPQYEFYCTPVRPLSTVPVPDKWWKRGSK